MQDLRPATLSGSWYPAPKAELTTMVDGFLANCNTPDLPAGRPIVAIVPHAGFAYSGPTAGKLYGLLQQFPPDRVIILAPSHRYPLAQIALSGKNGFQTPLGTVLVDQGAVGKLSQCPAFIFADEAHGPEHAVEIQLPFLQRLWPEKLPSIIPLLVPPLDQEKRALAVTALQEICAEKNTLFIVSTDFTHFGNSFGFRPFHDDIPMALERLDSGAILKILAGDGPGLREYGKQTGITMCGLEACAIALDCGLPAGYEGALLDYSRSADKDGDYSHSVSYASVLLCSGPTEDGLNSDDKKLLMELARRSVQAAVQGEPAPDPENIARQLDLKISPHLLEKRGAFVTLNLNGHLRGCIGYIQGFKPLLDTIVDNGRSAAINDPRFAPVSNSELNQLTIEISVLTPLRGVKGPENIEIGRHGILLSSNGRQSVFLPQVAVEQGWDLHTTLSQLSLKAGLSPNAWQQECQFQVFEADIFP